MNYGIGFSHMLGPSPGAADVVRLAQEAERIGYHSIVASDHVLEPQSFDPTMYPAGTFEPGVHWFDPFVALATIAGCTTTIRLGTGIAVVPYRPPVQQAQAVATLDFMSGGRFRYGAGIGWLREEFDALGIPFAERGERADEYLQVMKLLWSDSGRGFRGKFIDFPRWPSQSASDAETQPPHPHRRRDASRAPAHREVRGRVLHQLEGPGGVRRSPRQAGWGDGRKGRDVSELYMQLGATDVELVRAHKEKLPQYEAMGLNEIIYSPAANSAAEGLEMMRGFR